MVLACSQVTGPRGHEMRGKHPILKTEKEPELGSAGRSVEKCPLSSSRHSCQADDDCPFALCFLFILVHKTPSKESFRPEHPRQEAGR